MSRSELKEDRKFFWRWLQINASLMIASSLSLGKFAWYYLVPICIGLVGLVVNTPWFTNWYVGDDEADE